MSEITPFDFRGHNVRVVMVDGEPHFVVLDVCAHEALDLKNSRQAITSVDAEDVRTADILTAGGRQAMNVVTEAGLYQLIFQSRTSAAKDFRRWVTREVLPSIRKTGAYVATPPPMWQILRKSFRLRLRYF